MSDAAPDYAGIVARAERGEYMHNRPPLPEGIFPRPSGVLGRGFWPFGKDLERYLEKALIPVPSGARSITLRYERDRNSIRVTITMKRGKKRRYFIPAPLIDNMESMDT